jgi:diguanylate cyclase (GGDEF)-like protein/PAS domain S-box-containing protein
MRESAAKTRRSRRPALHLIPRSVRGRITLGFGLLVTILVVVVAGSVWLTREHTQSVDDVERTSTIVHLTENAVSDGSLAMTMLQSYVVTGNDERLDEMSSLFDSALLDMRSIRTLEASDGDEATAAELDGVIAAVDGLISDWNAAVALRRQGDEAGAQATLQASFTSALGTYDSFLAYADEERAKLAALRQRTSTVGNTALWLLVGSGAAGVALAIAASVLIARSIIRPLSELESATESVANGDLAARAHVGGPRELARLGASLNRMTEALLDASKRRELEEDRQRAFERLKESEERYRTLALVTPALIFHTDARGICLYVNDRWRDLTGLPMEAALGHGWATAVHPEDRQRTMSAWMDATARQSAFRTQFRMLRADGGVSWVEAQAAAQSADDGSVIGWVGTLLDVTERKQVELELRRLNSELELDRTEIETLNRTLEEKVKERTEQLRHANLRLSQRNRQLQDAQAQAATDALTGLGNHRAFQQRVRDEIAEAQSQGGRLGLIMLDVDGFKSINDSLGHLAGDRVLRELAFKSASLSGRENAYRYGGDEFAVLLPGAEHRELLKAADRLRRIVAAKSDEGQRTTVSLGVAIYPDSAATAEELIYGADAAMYWAKSAGKNRTGDWRSLLTSRRDGAVPWYAADRAVKEPDVVGALIASLAAKDPATSAHTERCSWYSARVSEELGLDEHQTSIVRLASLLHDIGKIAVPDDVLYKPGALSEEDWGYVRQHPAAGLHILAHIRSIAAATPAVLHHHEHYDGSGYPDGLAGEEIPIASRILLVTDAFDAMTTDRPYRKAMPVKAAVAELERNSGSQFDPTVVEAFLRVLAKHGPQPLNGGRQGGEPADPQLLQATR